VELTNNIWAIDDSLILLKDGSVLAVFEVEPQVINTIEDGEKEDSKDLVFNYLSSIADYSDFGIYTLNFDLELAKKIELLSHDIEQGVGTSPLANYVISNMADRLEEEVTYLLESKDYLVVPLKSVNVSSDFKVTVKQSVSNFRKSVMKMVGFEELPKVDWSKEWQDQKELIRTKLHALNIQEVVKDDLMLLNRIHFLNGQYYDKDSEIIALQNSIENVDETIIEIGSGNALKLVNGEEESYVATIPVYAYPKNVSYLHLAEEIKNIGFPVNSALKVKFSTKSGIYSLNTRARNKRKNLGNTVTETAENDDVQKIEVLESYQLLEDFQEKYDNKEPMITFLHLLQITGDSIEELNVKYDILASKLKDMEVEIVKAVADQVYLFYKFRMTELIDSDREGYLQYSSLRGLCENLFFTKKKVGTDVGFPIGRIDKNIASWYGDFKRALDNSTNVVFTNLLQANKIGVHGKETSNPHTAITGATGNGKSFLTKLLFTYHSFLKAKVLYVDPKAEMRTQYLSVLADLEEQGKSEELQEYIRSIRFITLDMRKEENKGVLDPFSFLEDEGELTELATVLVGSVLDKDTYIKVQPYLLDSLDKVIDRRKAGEKVGMLQVFDELEKSSKEEVSTAGYFLKRISKNSLLSLCFYDGSQGVLKTDEKTIIVEITGLDMPKGTDKDEMTETQLRSLTVMYALTYFCAIFGEREKDKETMLFLDEAWQIMSTPAGRQVVNRIKRTGRSFNNFLVLVTQSVKDLKTSDDTTGFGTVFAFPENTETEAILEHLRVENDELSRAWLENQTMGQCIYYDTFGRKERITVDGTINPELLPLFNTVDTKLVSVQ
jgi:putative conjugative transposon protein